MTNSQSDVAAAVERVRGMLNALGPDHALKVEARRARDRTRKRKVRRQQQTPEQVERERQRQRRARANKIPRPFLVIDGEGGGTDAIGRQPYLLMVAGDASGEMVRVHQ